MLYGTTGLGGIYGAGTIFSLDPSTGKETVLHSFGRGCEKKPTCKDGSVPETPLIDVLGTLYGTTTGGGTYELGTVFALRP
jgi:uncharacterized repeat protein (TIGR03803 family)